MANSQAPPALAVDSKGMVYISDSGNNRVQKFDSNGRFIAEWGSLGTGERRTEFPYWDCGTAPNKHRLCR